MRIHRLASVTALITAAVLPYVDRIHAGPTPAGGVVATETRAGALRPFLVHGELVPASTRARGAIALDAVARHAVWAQHLDLAPTRLLSGPDGSTTVVLSQTMGGLTVAERGARVVVEADGRVTLMTLALEERRPSSLVPAITMEEAKRIAVGREGLRGDAPRAVLVVWTRGGAPRLAYMISGGIDGLPFRPVMVIDAITSEVIVQYETAVSIGKAKVYEQNPKSTATTTEVTLANDPSKPGLENANVIARNCIDKKSVKDVDFGVSLKVHVCDLVPTIVADASGDYLDVLPGADREPEDKYAELSMYYHTDKAYRFARAIGFGSTATVTATSNLRIPQGFAGGFDPAKLSNPDLALVAYDNAFYAPADPTFGAVFGISGDAMWFGQGSLIDFGYDGDVVYHEFGHFVLNGTVNLAGGTHLDGNGASYSPGSLGEALADVFSSFITADPYVGEYAARGTGSTKGLRQLDNRKTFPTQLLGEVHNDSEPFSAAIWAVYAPLDATKRVAFQKAWLTAMSAAPTGDLGFDDLAKILVTTVTSKLDAATGTALRAAFDERGITAGDPRVRDANVKVNAVVPQLHFNSPGKKSVSSKGAYAPGVIQMRYDAASGGQATLHVSFSTASPAAASPFGGPTGTPFTPLLLVKPGSEAIKFTYGPTASDATSIPCVVAGDKKSATCDGEVALVAAADGSTAPVHLMIANAGDVDGAYDGVVVTADVIPAPLDDAGVDAGADAGLDPDGGNAAADGGGGSSGCGCTVPGESTDASVPTALAALGLAILARRRRRS